MLQLTADRADLPPPASRRGLARIYRWIGRLRVSDRTKERPQFEVREYNMDAYRIARERARRTPGAA